MTAPRRTTANGIEFAYLEAGPDDGPLALCLHGFPDHAPTYTQSGLLDALAGAGYHAVAPWLRGYSPTGLAADGNYEVASVAIASYVAAGHRPDRFTKLVTMAVPHQAALMKRFLSTPEQLKRSWYIFFFQTPLAEMVVPMNDFAVIDLLWRDWSPGLVPDPVFMRALKDTLGAPGSIEAAIGYYRAMLGTAPTTAAWASSSSTSVRSHRSSPPGSTSTSCPRPDTSCTSTSPSTSPAASSTSSTAEGTVMVAERTRPTYSRQL